MALFCILISTATDGTRGQPGLYVYHNVGNGNTYSAAFDGLLRHRFGLVGPSHANLFFVPSISSCEGIVDALDAHWASTGRPNYLRRRGGTDHFTLLPKLLHLRECSAWTKGVLANVTKLVGTLQSPWLPENEPIRIIEPRRWPSKKVTSLLLPWPANVSRADADAHAEDHNVMEIPSYFAAPYLNQGNQTTRATLVRRWRVAAVFNAFGHRNDHRQIDLRKALLAQCEGAKASCRALVPSRLPSRSDVAQVLMETYRQSVFALLPAGDEPVDQSLIDALVAGAIPVLFHHQQHLAWPLHWRATAASASLLLPADAVLNGSLDVLAELAAVPKARLARMKAAVQRCAVKISLTNLMPHDLHRVTSAASAASASAVALPDGLSILISRLAGRARAAAWPWAASGAAALHSTEQGPKNDSCALPSSVALRRTATRNGTHVARAVAPVNCTACRCDACRACADAKEDVWITPPHFKLSGLGQVADSYYHFLVDLCVNLVAHLDLHRRSVLYVPYRAGFSDPEVHANPIEYGDTDSIIDVYANRAFADRFAYLFDDAVRIQHILPRDVSALSARVLPFPTWKSRNGSVWHCLRASAGRASIRCDLWSAYPPAVLRRFRRFAHLRVGVVSRAVDALVLGRSMSSTTRLRMRTLNTSFLDKLTDLLRHEGLGGSSTRYVEFTLGTPLAEQVATFARARLVVGNHGAACVNLIFAPSECIFVELKPIIFPCYMRLAKGLGMRYLSGDQQQPEDVLSRLAEALLSQRKLLGYGGVRSGVTASRRY